MPSCSFDLPAVLSVTVSLIVVLLVACVPKAVKDSWFKLQLLSGRRLIFVSGRTETSEFTMPPTSLLEETSSSINAVRDESTWTGEKESHDCCKDTQVQFSHTHTHALTKGFQVRVFKSTEVKVEALQVCEVSQVDSEAVQSSSKTLVTGQVQLSQCGEAAE